MGKMYWGSGTAVGKIISRPGRAPLVSSGIWPQLRGSYLVYLAIIGSICLLRSLHGAYWKVVMYIP